MKKYELLENDTKEYCGRKLFRIKALVNIEGVVSAGDTGGYVEKESNLSMSGNAWVSDDARVYGNALVYGDALVYGNAQVYGDALVSKHGQCINITNFKYNITVTLLTSFVGCTQFDNLKIDAYKYADYSSLISESEFILIKSLIKICHEKTLSLE